METCNINKIAENNMW